MDALVALSTEVIAAANYSFLQSEQVHQQLGHKLDIITTYDLILPNINEIAEIPLEVHYLVNKKIPLKRTAFIGTYDIYFKIESPILTFSNDLEEEHSYVLFPEYTLVLDTPNLDLSCVLTTFCAIIQLLPLLKFNKYFGRFYLPNHPHLYSLALFGMEYSHSNVCSVCNDPCLLKTQCKHTLCVGCWSKLRDVPLKCPECRAQYLTASYQPIPEHVGDWSSDKKKFFPITFPPSPAPTSVPPTLVSHPPTPPTTQPHEGA